ncbi:MAG: phosphoribosylamine--glycine ligase [Candidatus Binatia bacterium]
MKVLVIGSGGREHALVWKIGQSSRVDKVYCAPGNAGIGELAELVAIAPAEIERLADFVAGENIDLTVVGPELPLTLGIADLFQKRGLRIFGPNREAAKLEGSKAFAKELLRDNHIPTASFATFADATSAKRYLAEQRYPCVIKADGLAAGKGVMICADRREAETAVDDILVRRVFGQAGDTIVIEEFLEGEEATFMAVTDGTHVLPLASSQDHKRVFDGDRGPNTGGMGAYSPAPVVTSEIHDRVLKEILQPLLRGLEKRKIHYAGLIYVGLMITDVGPKVLEFNVRFGDPECQPVLMRLRSDLVPLLEAAIDGKLDQVEANWHKDAAVCVVLCAAGYPGPYEQGKEIKGLEKLRDRQRVFAFHSGTIQQEGRWLTGGGRVVGITALGPSIEEATREAYEAVGEIRWDGMHFRRDIARRALRREG